MDASPPYNKPLQATGNPKYKTVHAKLQLYNPPNLQHANPATPASLKHTALQYKPQEWQLRAGNLLAVQLNKQSLRSQQSLHSQQGQCHNSCHMKHLASQRHLYSCRLHMLAVSTC
jgi:hypothetical protein